MLDKIKPYVHFIIYGGAALAAAGAGGFLPLSVEFLDLNESIKYVYAAGGLVVILLFYKFYGPLKIRDKFHMPPPSYPRPNYHPPTQPPMVPPPDMRPQVQPIQPRPRPKPQEPDIFREFLKDEPPKTSE